MVLLLLFIYIREWSDSVSFILISRKTYSSFHIQACWKCMYDTQLWMIAPPMCFTSFTPSLCPILLLLSMACGLGCTSVLLFAMSSAWIMMPFGWLMSLGSFWKRDNNSRYNRWYASICKFHQRRLSSDRNCSLEVFSDRIHPALVIHKIDKFSLGR